ncbi:MAG: DUF1592 domain-containing protein [Myxococcota bacterium]
MKFWCSGVLVAGLALGSACTGAVGEPAQSPDPAEETMRDRPGSRTTVVAQGVARLTAVELQNTFRDLLGEDLGVPFPAEAAGTFRNDAAFLSVSPVFIDSALERAEAAAAVIGQQIDGFAPCDSVGEECAQSFVRQFVARAWRRPVTAEEEARLLTVYRVGEETSYRRGIELVAATVFLSVPFLYREDEPDSEGRLDSYAVAQRLSYFLWDTMPDDELWDAAASGALTDGDARWAQAERMLADPRAVWTCREFFHELLHTDEVESAFKLPELFPAWDDQLPGQMRNELDALYRGICEENGSFRDLLTSRRTELDPLLAERVYEVAEDARELPETRAGVLARAGFLAVHGVAQSRPILRGLTVRERLLCDEVPNPPSSVDANPPEPGPMRTTRERFTEATSADSCVGCHQLMNPLGFAMEHFDAMGRERQLDNGIPVDATGIAIETDLAPFDGVHELQGELAESNQAVGCFVRQWFRYGLSREDDSRDDAGLNEIASAYGADLGYQAIVEGIVRSHAFATRHID